jgi:hypothetical protein
MGIKISFLSNDFLPNGIKNLITDRIKIAIKKEGEAVIKTTSFLLKRGGICILNICLSAI